MVREETHRTWEKTEESTEQRTGKSLTRRVPPTGQKRVNLRVADVCGRARDILHVTRYTFGQKIGNLKVSIVTPSCVILG